MRNLHFFLKLLLSLPLFVCAFIPSPYYNVFDLQLVVYLYISFIAIFLAGGQWAIGHEYDKSILCFSSILQFILAFVGMVGLIFKEWPPFVLAIFYLLLVVVSATMNYWQIKIVTDHIHRVFHWKSIVLFIAMILALGHLAIAYNWFS